MASYTFVVTSVTTMPVWGVQQTVGGAVGSTVVVCSPNDANLAPESGDVTMTIKGTNNSVVGSAVTVTTP